MQILGIETSCDETAAAVVADGRKQLASIVASQIAVHRPYGGVVPELASRRHMEAIVPVVARAIDTAGVGKDQIDAVAVTRGPGLVGALLVGFCFAKAYAFALRIPWVGVNHLEGHIHSLFLEAEPPPFPFVALLASGGHTCLYHVNAFTDIRLMGQTRDDAAGEAYDKVAKMLGLGYPGGQVIDELARQGDSAAVPLPRPYLDKGGFDFSFSGLKTAVRRHVNERPPSGRDRLADIAAAFQAAVVDVLVHKVLLAARTCRTDHLAVVGGVAANQGLRQRIRTDAAALGMRVHIPAVELCGDNAAMIAAAGYHHIAAGRRARLDDDVFSRNH